MTTKVSENPALLSNRQH